MTSENSVRRLAESINPCCPHAPDGFCRPCVVNLLSEAMDQAQKNKQCEADEREAQWCFECGLESQEKARSAAYRDASEIVTKYKISGNYEVGHCFSDNLEEIADKLRRKAGG